MRPQYPRRGILLEVALDCIRVGMGVQEEPMLLRELHDPAHYGKIGIDRGIESGLVPHCEKQGIAVVGYTPLAKGGFSRGVVADIAARHGRTPRQVALNFLTRRPTLFTIPKAGRPEHVRENAAALDFTLSPEEISTIDAAFPRG